LRALFFENRPILVEYTSDFLQDQPIFVINKKTRLLITFAALAALFLGALDALVMATAMPSIVADLGGLHLYSWVYSAYFLARAVSLPFFGKLADLYNTRNLFLLSISIFIVSSITAGLSANMLFLIISRVFQGIGAGGNFALVYIVLADISVPEKRGKTLSLASSVWGIASVLGPSLGGFIVSFFSWRWIFFMNVPLGLISLLAIGFYLVEVREKKQKVSFDFGGMFTLTLAILSLLTAFLHGSRQFGWYSWQTAGMLIVAVLSTAGFYHFEKRAQDPIVSVRFFANRGFCLGNATVFFSSFSIFSLFAFAPLFVQGALGKTPLQVGLAMLALSFGWSVGSIFLGQILHFFDEKYSTIAGVLFLFSGSAMTPGFSTDTSMGKCFFVFLLVGIGMGFVTLSTLVIVQTSVPGEDLGVATSSHQFTRTLGGAVGVGIGGSFVATRLDKAMVSAEKWLSAETMNNRFVERLRQNFEMIFEPEIQSKLPQKALSLLRESVVDGVSTVFYAVVISAIFCFFISLVLPRKKDIRK
jgi:EmrB/QacA subfamily drug resistance transporter